MAQLIITIPDAQLTRVLDALCAPIPEPNPPTPPVTQAQKIALARLRINGFIKGRVLQVERQTQVNALPPLADPGLS